MAVAHHVTGAAGGIGMQLETNFGHAMEAGGCTGSYDFGRRDHIHVSLSPEQDPI